MNLLRLRHRALKACATAGLLMAWVHASPAQSLEQQFRNPGPDTRPGCYWYWINDNISKPGITRDLEAMARVGIGRAYIGHIFNHREGGKDTPVGDVKFMSEAWWEALQWAVREADRCGVEIGFFNSPGWSQSGGPWIQAAQSMRYLAASETAIVGGVAIDQLLPVPEITTAPISGGSKPEPTGPPFTAADFQDVRVIAFRQPASELKELEMQTLKATSTTLGKKLPLLLDGSTETAVTLDDKPQVIEFELDGKLAVQSLRIQPVSGSFTLDLKIEASDQDEPYRILAEHSERRGHQGPRLSDPLLIPFPPTTAKHLRLTLSCSQAADFSELALSRRAVIAHHVRKQLGETHPSTNPPWHAYHWPKQVNAHEQAIDSQQVIDLSGMMDATGRLRWNAPQGHWIVMRAGMVPIGTQCHPASPLGRGLEVDKMSEAHVRSHFEGMVGEFLRRTPAADRKALKYVIADSYETGPQNWTDGFIEKFSERFGYSPLPFLPCIHGRMVDNPLVSSRFLWDWRRLIAESVAEDYVGGLRRICNEHGLKLWLENYGHWGFPSEFLLYGSKSDQVGGEFWESATIYGNIECRAAASSSHIYGRNEVYAEAFTSNRNFKQSPAELKSINDWVFAAGVNRLILHVYIHQPDERKPGIIQWFGTAFNRHNTWFDQSKAFIDYVRRSAVMLTAGRPVADIAYYIGEDAPVMTGPLDPELPDGFDFDHINADALIHNTRVIDGRICIENGPSYSVLVLPKQTVMTPEVAKAVELLVADGATILGPKPKSSPSLAGYPECDKVVASVTDPMWNRAADSESEHIAYGKGRVFTSVSLDRVLASLRLTPDLTVTGSGKLLCAAAGGGKIGRHKRGGIVFKHRTTQQREIYFLSNTTDNPADFMASFRVAGRKPWFWNANTGEIREVHAFSQEFGRTQIPMHLEASESLYVVFGSPIAEDASGSVLTNHREQTPVLTLSGPWKVGFEGAAAPAAASFATLIDWSRHTDPAIRHFSGSATYELAFDLDEKTLVRPIRLNLGTVGVIATVAVNGQQAGTVWTAPWSIDISKFLKPGRNTLSIRVTSTWNNRLVADAGLPAAQRVSHVSQGYRFNPKDALHPSGLIGPVRLTQAK